MKKIPASHSRRARRIVELVTTIAPLLMAAGCSRDYRAEIHSDTSWQGEFSGIRREGSGDARIDLGSSPYCAHVMKTTSAGVLRMRIVSEGNLLSPDKSTSWSETSSPYAGINICAHW